MYSLANWPHRYFSPSKSGLINGPTSIMVINLRHYYFNFSATFCQCVCVSLCYRGKYHDEEMCGEGKINFTINKQAYKYLCFVITPNLQTHTHHQYTQTQSQHSSTTMMWFMRPELDAALRGNALSSYLPPLWKAGLGSFRRREKPYKLLPREIHTPTELQKEVEHSRNTLLLMTSLLSRSGKWELSFEKNTENWKGVLSGLGYLWHLRGSGKTC